jgi:hypothetical protein
MMVRRESILAAGLERKKSIYGNEWITPFNGKRMDTIRKAVLQREKNERRKPFNDKNWMGLEFRNRAHISSRHSPRPYPQAHDAHQITPPVCQGRSSTLPCWLFEYLHSAIRV